MAQVAFYAAVLWRRRREVLGDIDEDASFVGPDLVHEDGGLIAQQHMAEMRLGEVRVDQLKPPEPRAHPRRMGVVLFPKLGVISVRDDGEMREVAITKLVLGDTVHAQNLLCMRARNQIRRLGLDNRHIRTRFRRLAQLHHEPAMVERTALRQGFTGTLARIRDSHWLSEVRHVVAVDADGVDILDTIAEAQFFQRVHAARLQQFAHDAVWFFQRALQEQDAPSLSPQGHCESAA